MKNCLFSRICVVILTMCSCLGVQSQETEQKPHWYVGLMGGYRWGGASISELNKEIFPDAEGKNSGLFSLFVQYEWGQERQFAVRPELTFLSRGLKLPGIGKDFVTEDITYSLKSKYIDVRVPIIWNIGKYDWTLRPYIYVAPIVGFSTGGYINLNSDLQNGYYEGYSMDLTDANMASAYFAASIGAGLKYGININGSKCYLGLEANYEFGLSNTYSKKERDGEAIIESGLLTPVYQIDGSRKFNGLELRASFAMPFSIFKKKTPKPAPEPAPVVEVAPAPVPAPVVVEEKPCYSLDEILALITKGERVEGKTICAVDMINFDFGKSSIKPESHAYLDKIVALITRTNIKMEIKGHTDNVGNEDFNMKLSKDRAKAVYDYLVSHGVKKSSLSYSYYGMTRPLDTNETEEGRKMNRRVEFEIK
jgi:outer membrane protein OmpA-like peptidoglycan-associated protein